MLTFWTSLFNSVVVGMRPALATMFCQTSFSISVLSCLTVMGSLFVRLPVPQSEDQPEQRPSFRKKLPKEK